MTTIYLIRHAEAEGNIYRRIHGWYDSVITDNGYLQIKELEKRFSDIPIDAVYSSDLFRTKTTARALYLPKGLELQVDPGLREFNFGLWEDLSWGEARRRDEAGLALFNASSPLFQAPGGERFADLGARMERTLQTIVKRHPGEAVAVFSHGTAIRQMVIGALGIRPEDWHTRSHSDNTGVTELQWDGTRFYLLQEGDCSHLSPELSTLNRQAWWRKKASGTGDINLWYRPVNPEEEGETYLAARREAWTTVHGHGPLFDGEGFLRDAHTHAGRMEWGLTAAMAGERLAGVLQLDPQRYEENNAGYIAFCYMTPETRAKALGVQLIGQAVSVFRPMGREYLRLRCASYNEPAQRFYQRYGFYKIGVEQGNRVPLDILEKYIGYDYDKAQWRGNAT